MNSNRVAIIVIIISGLAIGLAAIAGAALVLNQSRPPIPTERVDVVPGTREAGPDEPADSGEPAPITAAPTEPEAPVGEDEGAPPEEPIEDVTEDEEETDEEETESAERCQDVRGVIRHSETRYTLQKDFLDRFIFDQQRAQQLGAANWKTNKRGQKVGVRVRRLKCPPIAAGLQNKDVVKEVNGRPMTSMTAALAAYAEIKLRKQIDIKVRRDKKNIVLRYTLER